jgi:hypothetical protein
LERWEYKTIKLETRGIMAGNLEVEDLEKKLNVLGEHGWEMISFLPTSSGQGTIKEAVATLKRRK